MRNKIGYLLILFLLATATVPLGGEPKQKQVVRGTIEKIDPSAKKLTIKKEKKWIWWNLFLTKTSTSGLKEKP